MIHTKAQLLACALAALSWLSLSAHLVSSSSSERDRALTTNSWVLVTFERKRKTSLLSYIDYLLYQLY